MISAKIILFRGKYDAPLSSRWAVRLTFDSRDYDMFPNPYRTCSNIIVARDEAVRFLGSLPFPVEIDPNPIHLSKFPKGK